MAPASHSTENAELRASQGVVERLLEESLRNLEEEQPGGGQFLRWELGACWIQHLQDQKNSEKDKKPSSEKSKNEMKVEGLGTPLKSLKNKKKDGNNQRTQSESLKSQSDAVIGDAENAASPSVELTEAEAIENELALKSILSDASFARLKESETGLHRKVMSLEDQV